jgi:polysaccharide export outer membrane protein
MNRMRRNNLGVTILLWGLSSALFLTAQVASAQETPLGTLPVPTTKLEQRLTAQQIPQPAAETYFEGPVDPQTFQLGPGDLLGIYLWRPTTTQFSVRVDAEGNAVIPTVGPVKVTGMPLTDAKRAILREILARYAGAEITVSLQEVRKFRVHVCGAVAMPGSYLVPATARVADAILLAGGLLKRPRAEWDTTSIIIASQRRIQVSSAADPHTSHSEDLLLFEKAGRAEANPYLRDGDVVWVPFKEKKYSEVGVFGGVFRPDLYEYAPGDQVKDLIDLAGGTRSSARLFESYLVQDDGQRVAIADSAALKTEVQAGDRLYVPMGLEEEKFGTITLQGEIANPGSYPIEIGKTTLRQVLGESGGLLPTAAVNSARLIRVPPEFRDPEKGRLLRPREPGTVAQRTAFENELAAAYERWMGSTVVLNLSESADTKDPGKDIVLQDGDVLEVPKEPLGIRMLGYVNQTGETPYHPNWNLDDYLEAVGGMNRGGWKSQTRVIKASTGSIVLYSSRVPLDPGDIVFVPSKPPGTTWNQIRDGIAVVSQVATIVLIVITASK